MGIEGFGRYGGPQMGVEGALELFWMAQGGMESLGWVMGSGVVEVSLALGGGPRVGVKG